MRVKFRRPASLKDVATHYCAGCGHGIVHRIVAEVVDSLEIREKTVGVAPVGCAVIAYDYWDFDCSEAAHGRALAVATGIKRCRPELVVFTYQGDGDLASIGIAETIHTANRGENLTCIFINNACYGMTGGQMAPTTLVGQRTTTTPWGRDPRRGEGFPLRICELLTPFPKVVYIERTTLSSPKGILQTKRAIQQAFLNQIKATGFSLVEVLSPCPTIWGLSPKDSMDWIEKEMMRIFPVGRIK